MSADYVCTLDEDSVRKAKEELSEDPAQRKGAVEELRAWVEAQANHLRYPTDDVSMLQMLRYAKFDQSKARETIESYCTMKSKNPRWYNDHDTTTDVFQKFIEMGYIVPLPKRTPNGEKLCVFREGAYDPKEWKVPAMKLEMIRSFNAAFLAMLRDECTMVNGVVYLMDYSNATMAHYTFWNGEEAKEIMKTWQSAIPNRYKALYAYSIGSLLWSVFEKIYELAKPFLGEKVKSRFHVIGADMEKLYNHIPKDCLPLEYLPDGYTGPSVGSLKDVIAQNLEDLRSPQTREYLTMISSPRWGLVSEDKSSAGAPASDYTYKKQ